MKKELLNIINSSVEPVYELDLYIEKLKTSNRQDSAWYALKEIALEGEPKQRFVALTVISVNKPGFMEALSFELIKNKNYAKIETLLKPIINICSIVKNEKHMDYLIEVLNYSIKNIVTHFIFIF